MVSRSSLHHNSNFQLLSQTYRPKQIIQCHTLLLCVSNTFYPGRAWFPRLRAPGIATCIISFSRE